MGVTVYKGGQGSSDVSFDKFRVVLGRYFFTDGVSLGNERILYEQWKAYINDQSNAFRLKLSIRFGVKSKDMHGLLWWEERQIYRSDPLTPISHEEGIPMYLCAFPGLLDSWHCPQVRPYCPNDIAGQWRLSVTQAADANRACNILVNGDTIVLCQSGTAHIVGSSVNHVGTWRVHILPTGSQEFWYCDTRGQQHKLKLVLSDSEMELHDDTGKYGSATWIRIQ